MSYLTILLALDPCGPSGECTNLPGRFQCRCNGSTGNRCQYTTVCTNANCSSEEVCMESLVDPDGYVCVEVQLDILLIVTDVDIEIGFLDDLLVNYREALLQQVAIIHSDCIHNALSIIHTVTHTHSHIWNSV